MKGDLVCQICAQRGHTGASCPMMGLPIHGGRVIPWMFERWVNTQTAPAPKTDIELQPWELLHKQ